GCGGAAGCADGAGAAPVTVRAGEPDPSAAGGDSGDLSVIRARSVHWFKMPGPYAQILSCSWSIQRISPWTSMSSVETLAQRIGPGSGVGLVGSRWKTRTLAFPWPLLSK